MENLEELKGEWIECKKGCYPEDILGDEYWKRSYTGAWVQSFRVKLKGNGYEAWGIRLRDSGTWDHKKDIYSHWKF